LPGVIHATPALATGVLAAEIFQDGAVRKLCDKPSARRRFNAHGERIAAGDAAHLPKVRADRKA
jgi:hypothetical protein